MKVDSNGLILDKDICGISVIVSIIQPKGRANVRTLKKMNGNPKYIIVHNAGETASALTHNKALQNLENMENWANNYDPLKPEKNPPEYLSFQIAVDTQIVQNIPLNETAYHAGDGTDIYKSKGNGMGIGVEICENGDYSKNQKNACILIVELMKFYNIPIENVLSHRHVSSNKKLCPYRILKSEKTWVSDWQKFIDNEIKTLLNPVKKQETVVESPKATVEPVSKNTFADNSKVKFKKDLQSAVYGGQSTARGQQIPLTTLNNSFKYYTVVKTGINKGVEEILLKEINSWIAAKYFDKY